MKTIDSKTENWQRLATVTPEEKRKAMEILVRWVTWQIIYRGFNLDHGPFSCANMGGNAVEIISQECCEALFCGEWLWNPNRKLSSMLIQIAKSKMGHIIRDYYKKGQPEMMLTSDQNFREEVEMNIASQLEKEANLRDLGYEIARDVAKGHPQLLAYLDALYKDNDYYGIASLMGTTPKKVMELEKQLLDLLENI